MILRIKNVIEDFIVLFSVKEDEPLNPLSIYSSFIHSKMAKTCSIKNLRVERDETVRRYR